MIKRLHMVAALLMASALSVFAQAPKWVAIQDAPEVNEIGITSEKTQDNNVVFVSNYATTATAGTNDYFFMDLANGNKTSEKTYNGATEGITATSGNYNLVVNKVSAQTGHLIWTVQSNLGEFSSTDQKVAATADNGVVLFLKVRHTNLGGVHEDILCQFVDDKGNVTPVKWQMPRTPEYTGYTYQPVIVKINADGTIAWAKHYDAGYQVITTGKDKGKNGNDSFSVGALVVDKNGNIYVAGRYSYTLIFGEKANFTTPHNITAWDGSSKGALYVAKLDAAGNALWGITTRGDAAVSDDVVKYMDIDNDKLYILANETGIGSIELGKTTLTTTTKYNLLTACLSLNDGSVAWAKNIDVKAHAATMNINVVGENLYVGGGFKGVIKDGDKVFATSVKGQISNPFILKCSANDGSVIKGINFPADNGYINAIHEVGSKILASGYDMGAYKTGFKSNAYIYEVDNNLTTESAKTHTVKSGKQCTSQSSSLIGDWIISVTSGKNPATITGLDWGYGEANNKYAMFMCHALSDFLPLDLNDNVKYVATEDKQCGEVTYSRNFTNTNWQALYLPFGLNVADLQADFEVARINDVHQFDTNNDGTIDETKLEVIILADGVTEANVPYLIKAKAAGLQTLRAKNVLVKAAAPFQREMTSWNTSFVINGTYTGVEDMSVTQSYALVGGVLEQATTPAKLNGYRWYLDVKDRNGNVVAPTQIKLLVVDQNGNVTGVEEIEANAFNSNVWPANVYNVQGKLVKANAYDLQGLPKGVYIVNGKKVIR